MVRKISLATVMVLSLGTGAFADGFYAKLSGGFNKADANMDNGNSIDFNNGKVINLAIGKSFNAFDVEIEYSHGSHDWENKTINAKGDGTEKGYFLNGYYNFNLDSKITPYVGVGLGRLKYDDGFTAETKTSYQGMLGGAYAVTEKVDLNLEYKYRKADYSATDLSSNNYLVGIKYKF